MKTKIRSALLLLTLLCTFVFSACATDNSGTSAGSVGLTYKASDDGKTCTVTGMGTCTDKELKIPETIEGHDVTAIGASAFAQNADLTSAVIPFGVKTITTNAFLECSALTYVVLPATLEKIGASAFRDCSVLGTVYYAGSQSDWADVTIGDQNDDLKAATVLYYSDFEPASGGNYWRYVDGVPTKW